VVPAGKQAPDRCDEVSVGVPQLSVILGADQRATAQVAAVVKVIFKGHLVMTGFVTSPAQGVLSVTVTRKEQVAVLFFVSVAV
jgi:hypothetical protein